MFALPRLAVGTVQPEAESLPLLWALSEVCERQSLHVQNFLSRSCFTSRHGGLPTSGRVRHLDSWLMSRDVCREIFVHGSRSSDLAIIEGRFDASDGSRSDATAGGGSLEQLCEWLDLPRIVVLDVAELDACRIPERPVADGLLLDRVNNCADFARLQTRLEALWGVPVLGALERLDECRERIATLPPGEIPPRKLCHALGESLKRHLRSDRFWELAAARPFPPVDAHRLLPGSHLAEVTIAVAYDEVFNCYFPDTLDLLELQGATVHTFSPLHDGRLPDDADVVYFGCGHPELALERLSANQCMRTLLSNHVFSGGRIYAEGGGLAYLCEAIETADGSRTPMAGLLPAIARLREDAPPPKPVEITLAQGNWLGEGWSQLRGYLNTRWELTPTGPLKRYAAQPGHELDLVGSLYAIGSRIHLNFAAQPEFLQAFFAPHPIGADLSE